MREQLKQGWEILQLGLIGLFLAQVVMVFPTRVNQVRPSSLKGPESSDSLDSAVSQRMKGVYLVEAGREGRLWQLWAGEAQALKDRPAWDLGEVRVKFFSQDGVEFLVTGEKGTVDVQSKDVVIEGHVVTQSSNGYMFRSDRVTFVAAERALASPRLVTMEGPPDASGGSLTLEAEGMRADLNSGEMRLLKGVRGSRWIKKGQLAKIQSHMATVSSHHRRARFEGNVVLEMDDAKVTGQFAEFDYASELNQLKGIEVGGGTKLHDKDKQAKAQSLKVDVLQDRVYLIGKPQLSQGLDLLQGEQIIIEDRGRRVRVDRPRARVNEANESVAQ